MKIDIEQAERLFLEELVGFARTVNARSKMLLEAAENLRRRRAIVERARPSGSYLDLITGARELQDRERRANEPPADSVPELEKIENGGRENLEQDKA